MQYRVIVYQDDIPVYIADGSKKYIGYSENRECFVQVKIKGNWVGISRSLEGR